MTNSTRVNTRHRALLGIGPAVLCVALALAIAPKAAQASASGCTGLDGWKFSNVCISVIGSGLTVKEATASFSSIGRPCNTQLRISFFDTKNHMYSQYRQGLKTGCRFSGTYRITPNAKFRTGRACGSVVISGSAKPGACISIFP